MRLSGTKTGAVNQYRGLGDQLWDLGGARPSLDLNFAQTKSLVDATTGSNLVDFTRASSGTYVGSDGLIKTATTNEARFNHDPTTGESLGLLVEESRTNLLLQGNQFDTTWTNSNSSETATSGTAPDGTNTAWELKDTSDGTAFVHSVNAGSISLTSGTAYTVSIFAKRGTLNGIAFVMPAAAFTSNLNTRFNLQTGVVASSDAGFTGTITAYPNGWYRCTATATATATASGAIQVRIATASTSFYQGDGTGTILIWGAQLEAGAFPTSYIPTTSSTVTRAADVASISGSNFSSWYRQGEGTVFATYIIPALANGTISSFDDTTVNNRWQQRFTTNGQRYRLQASGVSLLDSVDLGAPNVNTSNKIAQVLRAGDQRHSAHGSLNDIAFTAATLPVVTQLQVGTGPGADVSGRILIGRLTYWPQRLPNETLQTITQ